MIKENKKILLPVILAFVMLNAIITVFRTFLETNGLDTDFVIMANLFFFILTLAGFFVQRKGLRSDNPNVFVRGVYASILLKLFLCIAAVTIYAFIKAQHINKPAIFVAM